MKKLIALLLQITWLVGFANVTHSMANELKSKPGALSECNSYLDQAQTLNAFDLFIGTNACSSAGLAEQTAFLLHIGQIRAVADLEVLGFADKTTSKK